MKSKKKTYLAGISISLILILLGTGFYLFFSTTKLDFLKAEKDGMTLEAIFYNSNGEIIESGLAQTTVSYAGKPKESGLFYMSLNIKSSNIGTARLTNFRMITSAPSEFTLALQNANPLKSVLEVGETNILEWNTANVCGVDAECGSSERCINSFCLIDISNFLGEIDFTTTLEADWVNAQGISQTTSTTILLPILFEQDSVLFRQSYLIGDSPSIGDWIAIDTNEDGILEGWGSPSSIGASAKYSGTFLGYDTEGREIIFRETTNEVFIYRGYTISHQYYGFDEAEPLAIISNIPTEPYTSENCGGTKPCMEVYSIAVAPPSQTCGNDIREGSELCDGTDLNGNDCTTIGESFTGGTLSCNSCTSWDTSLCTGGEPSGNVIFRTTDLAYGTGTNGISYSDTCGGNLVAYGVEYDASSLTETCEEKFDNPAILENLPGSLDLEYGDGNVKLFSDNSDPNEIWVCENTPTGTPVCRYRRYDTDDCGNGVCGEGNCVSLSCSSTSIDSLMEVSC